MHKMESWSVKCMKKTGVTQQDCLRVGWAGGGVE